MVYTKPVRRKSLFWHNAYRYSLLILLCIAIALQGGLDIQSMFTQDPERKIRMDIDDIRSIFPQTYSYNLQEDKTYLVFSDNLDTLGRIIQTYAFTNMTMGFAGKIPMLIAINMDNRISGIHLLRHHESEEYMEYIIADSLLNRWNLKSPSGALRVEVDAVTSATETSEAIINDIRNSLANYSGTDISGVHQAKTLPIPSILIMLVILAGILVCYIRPLKRYRFWLLLASAIVLGFMYQTMLSAALIHGWMINGLPWKTGFPVVLLLILSILIPVFSKQNFYCHYICPYGAVQEIAGRISPWKKKPLNRLRIFSYPVRSILCMVLLLGLLTGYHSELSLVEPFTAFSIRIVSWGILAFGIVFIIGSLFFSKPWCSFCPTGFFLDSCKRTSVIPSTKKAK